MDKLTPEQQELVEQNMRLVHHAIKRYFPFLYRGKEYEDWVQIGMLGVCQAAKSYDPGTGLAFSTLACVAVKNEIVRELVRRNTKGRKEPSFVRSMQETLGLSDGLLEETLADPKQDVERKQHINACLKRIWELSGEEPYLYRAATGQITNREAGKALGVSHTLIYLKRNEIREKLKEEGLW